MSGVCPESDTSFEIGNVRDIGDRFDIMGILTYRACSPDIPVRYYLRVHYVLIPIFVFIVKIDISTSLAYSEDIAPIPPLHIVSSWSCEQLK